MPYWGFYEDATDLPSNAVAEEACSLPAKAIQDTGEQDIRPLEYAGLHTPVDVSGKVLPHGRVQTFPLTPA